ncbi:Rz-like lysis system protein LysB [Pseudomonas nitroreducens]|uniref:Rz-like lysis system protein LysB n=1 Tax=Pseudomonas nitroreducens TaxID=46680 RepID=UPI00244C23FC|nr:Rz-like lysis system protein LysB [Pseudomonas nitroreducens]MDG9854116.1 Rz-like lysis system protein LysB [Pseudomonas nitroreducens]
MSPLRQALYGVALLGSLALLLWGYHQRDQAAAATLALVSQQRQDAEDRNDRQASTITALQDSLLAERQAQSGLRTMQDQLRQGLAARQRQIEDLKRENQELREWAAQQLPDAARRLRQRPTLTGADAYRNWLSGRGAVPAAGDGAGP